MTYFKMHRGWMDNPVLDMGPFDRRSAFAWLIEKANWKDGAMNYKGQAIQVLRGQLFTSYRNLASAWKWPEATVRRYCVAAASQKMIHCVTVAGQTLITVCNYDKYQGDECVDDADVARHRRSGDAQQKEEKEEKINNARVRVREDAPDGFEELWKFWKPAKGGISQSKPDALKAYKAALKAKALPEAIMSAAIAEQAALKRINRWGTEFAPGLGPWIRRETWKTDDSTPREADRTAEKQQTFREMYASIAELLAGRENANWPTWWGHQPIRYSGSRVPQAVRNFFPQIDWKAPVDRDAVQVVVPPEFEGAGPYNAGRPVPQAWDWDMDRGDYVPVRRPEMNGALL